LQVNKLQVSKLQVNKLRSHKLEGRVDRLASKLAGGRVYRLENEQMSDGAPVPFITHSRVQNNV